MKIRIKASRCKTAEDRQRIAVDLSRMFGVEPYPGIPYKPNEHDSHFWTLDGGNDWKVYFHEEDPGLFEIRHRYQKTEAVEAITKWAAYRLIGEVVE
jgi:hypothetical protein